MAIQKISAATVNSLVSASSVYSTPCIVKELIDNAIDANATEIHIQLDNDTGGLRYLNVKDNGDGVAAEDRDLMCCDHTTSKLTNETARRRNMSYADIPFLGFRGEALFFVSQLINMKLSCNYMSVTSRTAIDDVGETWKIEEDGKVKGKRENIAAEVGTSVIAVGLFSKTPIRYKMLRKSSQKAIDDIKLIIRAYAMCFRGLRLSLKLVETAQGKISPYSKGRKDMTLAISSSKLALLAQICKIQTCFRSFFEGTFTNIEDSTGQAVVFKVEYVLPLANGESQANTFSDTAKFLSVNRRPLDRNKSQFFEAVNRLIEKVYESLELPKPKIWCLDVDIVGKHNVDVNIEPLKNDVLIVREQQLLDTLKCSLEVDVAKAHSPSRNNEETFQSVIIKSDLQAQQSNFIGPSKNQNEEHMSDFSDDWNFTTHEIFSEVIDDESTFYYEKDSNEDITISNDITLSNPFLLSKIQNPKTFRIEESANVKRAEFPVAFAKCGSVSATTILRKPPKSRQPDITTFTVPKYLSTSAGKLAMLSEGTRGARLVHEVTEATLLREVIIEQEMFVKSTVNHAVVNWFENKARAVSHTEAQALIEHQSDGFYYLNFS